VIGAKKEEETEEGGKEGARKARKARKAASSPAKREASKVNEPKVVMGLGNPGSTTKGRAITPASWRWIS